jgi:hypothetical protein
MSETVVVVLNGLAYSTHATWDEAAAMACRLERELNVRSGVECLSWSNALSKGIVEEEGRP